MPARAGSYPSMRRPKCRSVGSRRAGAEHSPAATGSAGNTDRGRCPAAGTPTTSIICGPIPHSSWPADGGNEKPVVRSPECHILGALIASKILILKMQQDKNPEVQRSLGLDEKICGQRTCDTRNRCSTSFGDENSFQGYCPAHRDNSNSDFDYFG